MIDRRTSQAPERRELAVDSVRNRTRICRHESGTHLALEALGWETLVVDDTIALMKAPEGME